MNAQSTPEMAIAATWDISFRQLAKDSRAAVALMNLFAFLGPDNFPLDVLRDSADHLPPSLGNAARNPEHLSKAIATLLRYSMIRRDADTISVHRTVQAVAVKRLSPRQTKTWAERAVKLMDNALPDFPYDSFDSGVAAIYDRLLTHALAAAGHAEVVNVALEQAVRIFNQVGFYQKMRADLVGARTNFERALAIDENTFGPQHPEVAIDVNNLSLVLKDQGDLERARTAIERALAIDEKAFGPNHPNVAIRLSNLGSVLRDKGDLEGARRNYERALIIDEKAFGLDDINVAIRINNLGRALQDQGDLEQGRANYERALSIFERHLDPEHPSVAKLVSNLGGVLRELGDLDGARKHLERALAIFRKSFPDEHPDVQRVRRNLERLGE